MALIDRKRNEQRRLKKSCKHNKQHSFKNEQKFLCELRVIRKEKRLTQQELAYELSVTRQYISLLERGEAQAAISIAMEIANKLNTCVYTLFGFNRFECEQCHEGVGGN